MGGLNIIDSINNVVKGKGEESEAAVCGSEHFRQLCYNSRFPILTHCHQEILTGVHIPVVKIFNNIHNKNHLNSLFLFAMYIRIMKNAL